MGLENEAVLDQVLAQNAALEESLSSANRMIAILIHRLGGEVRISNRDLREYPQEWVTQSYADRANHEFVLTARMGV
jgi:bifunctional ADP-heptose synthase (sugar kinase/adenylyltransferase)